MIVGFEDGRRPLRQRMQAVPRRWKRQGSGFYVRALGRTTTLLLYFRLLILELYNNKFVLI